MSAHDTLSSLDISRGGSKKHVPKNFDILPFASVKCRVHPVVVFTILDGYVRREDDQSYVIGTLMGMVSEGNVVDVTDCFVDRHSLTETGLLQIIKDHHESMFELKQKVNPKEQVVGWFCTGAEMTELTCAVHGWFKSFSSVSKFQPHPPLVEPLHLMVDTTLSEGFLAIRAFLQVPMGLVKDACCQFHQIHMEIQTSQAEKAGMAVLLKARQHQKSAILADDSSSNATTTTTTNASNVGGASATTTTTSGASATTATTGIAATSTAIAATSTAGGTTGSSVLPPQALKEGFEASMEKLQQLLGLARKYVEEVMEGTQPPDSDLGRFLHRSLCGGEGSLVDSEQYERMCQTSLQDTLMISYLTALARIQFAVAEKLNTSFF
eukprot:GHVS01003900.1.p1 GENE.GHVS01003900.1~~GHVS01003900.1.p1  ORF type:complete len:381 (+),score=91.46 GHVS01003900.1:56-1198(+)